MKKTKFIQLVLVTTALVSFSKKELLGQTPSSPDSISPHAIIAPDGDNILAPEDTSAEILLPENWQFYFNAHFDWVNFDWPLFRRRVWTTVPGDITGERQLFAEALALVIFLQDPKQYCMKRVKSSARVDWQEAVESIGFHFHTGETPYWDESAHYEFTMQEILLIESKTKELWDMCLEAVEFVIDNRFYANFHIPDFIIPLIEKSWDEDHPSIYGRFDFCFKNGKLKLYEFNADTPTSLFEMAVVQWHWLQDYDRTADQFNSAHEKLIAYWKHLHPYLNKGALYFSCVKDSIEDLTTIEYLRDCAIQAGLQTDMIFMDDIGWRKETDNYVDLLNKPIANVFKLYPWEYMIAEPFGKELLKSAENIFWIEPAWKMILSNKAILPLLYQLFPENDVILQASDIAPEVNNYVKKPIFGREGQNITIKNNGFAVETNDGVYGEDGFIYQQVYTLPEFDGRYPLIGSWIIGGEPAGIGIRESDSLITNNTSRFIPHLIK